MSPAGASARPYLPTASFSVAEGNRVMKTKLLRAIAAEERRRKRDERREERRQRKEERRRARLR
jgi:hypothetical protein